MAAHASAPPTRLSRDRAPSGKAHITVVPAPCAGDRACAADLCASLHVPPAHSRAKHRERSLRRHQQSRARAGRRGRRSVLSQCGRARVCDVVQGLLREAVQRFVRAWHKRGTGATRQSSTSPSHRFDNRAHRTVCATRPRIHCSPSAPFAVDRSASPFRPAPRSLSVTPGAPPAGSWCRASHRRPGDQRSCPALIDARRHLADRRPGRVAGRARRDRQAAGVPRRLASRPCCRPPIRHRSGDRAAASGSKPASVKGPRLLRRPRSFCRWRAPAARRAAADDPARYGIRRAGRRGGPPQPRWAACPPRRRPGAGPSSPSPARNNDYIEGRSFATHAGRPRARTR